jgi:hypothetical protein
MKTLKHIIYIALIVLLCSACVEQESPQKKVEIKQVNTKNQHSKVVEQSEVTKESDEEITKVSEWKDNAIQKSEYNMSQGTCKDDSLIAPAYVDEKRIVYLSYGTDADRIYEFSTEKQECKVLYKSQGIGNITGNNGKLFWSEYDTQQLSNVEWKIKSLDLSNKKVSEISSGGSYKDTPTPTVRNGVDSVNWIEYEIKGNSVISKLVQYDTKNENKLIVSEVSLDESDARKGEYFILQQAAEKKEKMLVYKTFFKEGEKSFELGLYQNGKPVNTLLKENKVLDFVSNEKYFAYTGEGHLTAFPMNNPNQKLKYKTGNRLTTDTPIFIDPNTIIFRYAMNELIIVNLDKKVSYSLTGYSQLVSKPVYNNGLLSYGMKSGEEGNEKISFFVVKID